MQISSVDTSTCLRLEAREPSVGALQLWVPEAIATEKGFSAIYPTGRWTRGAHGWSQRVSQAESIGPGNCRRIDDRTFHCGGVTIPVDSPVAWTTDVVDGVDGARFTIRLTNEGDAPLRKAAAAICFKFLDAPWWSDDCVYIVANGRLAPISELGRAAGFPNGFQAWLVGDAVYDQPFYREFWGLNGRRADRGLLISENRAAGLCVGIEGPAYFVHSNRGNPCTDLMLSLGDVAPRATVEGSGIVWVRKGRAAEAIGA